jgi:hypothetical protein
MNEEKRKPGRPKTLGTATQPTQVYFTPAQLEWLKEQPEGMSAVLRRLVNVAINTERMPKDNE